MAIDRPPLPIDTVLPDVKAALAGGRDVVLTAEPGAGKTTRLPPAAADILPGRTWLLQPRRVAARAAAARVADEAGVRVGGDEVGYQVRFEKAFTPRTRLLVMTQGVALRRLVADPTLDGVACVILDEFHERSVQADLVLAMLAETKAALREDLRVVVMSATLEAGPAEAFLARGGPVARFDVPGRLYPVDVRYAGDAPGRVEDRVDDHVRRLLDDATFTGDVLAFLPGVRECEHAAERVARWGRRYGYDVLPLHGSLDKAGQDRVVFKRPGDGPRVICATNLAETSLTLPDVRAVVDSGLMRRAGFDARRGVDTLQTARISRASAGQRAGRAGRTSAGVCVRLWSKVTHAALDAHDTPEVRRVDLGEAVLAVLRWGGDPATFGWYERPPAPLVEAAMATLQAVGAVEGGRITSLGRRIADRPVPPRAARLLDAAPAWLRQEAATAAALLAEGVRHPTLRTCTAADLVEALRRRHLDPATDAAVRRAREALLAGGSAGAGEGGVGSLEDLLLLAYPDRLCRKRSPESATTAAGGGVVLADPSAVRGELFLALDMHRGASASKQEAWVSVVAEVEPEALDRLLPGRVQVQTAVELGDDGRVKAVRRTRFGALVLREDPRGVPDAAAAEAVLRDRLVPQADDLVAGDEAASATAARLTMLRACLPGHMGMPARTSGPAEWVGAACAGAASVGEVVSRLGRVAEDFARVEAGSLLDREAPATFETPAGGRVKLDWTACDASSRRGPVLAVRVQELFGLTGTPRVCAATVPVVLHLLGPNFRPVQVTDDLASFWKNTYPQVRKDLRARYPRHAWPEDPTRAPAVRGPRRRGS